MIRLPKNEGLNVVPFIDIMLVLLAIVLTTSSFIAQGELGLDLPRSNAAENFEEKHEVKVAIDSNNTFFLNGEKVSFEALKASFEEISPQTLVELKSDKNARFESFVKILDLLKAANHTKLVIITQKEAAK